MKKYMKLAVPVVLAVAAIYACNKLNAPEITAVSGDNPMYVSIDEAESMLLEIMDRMDAIGTKSDGGSVRRTISGRYSKSFSDATKSGDEVPVVHVFNFEDESGFAIMSGDKRINPLLAYTFKGSLEEGKPIENPGLALYMAGLENMMNGIVMDTCMIGNDTVPKAYFDMEIYDMINGPCPVKWNQTHPYNYYCEEYSGGKLVTGCVATAVAQLMACYRYPDSYKEYTFDWDAMIEASNEPYVPEVPEVPKDTFVMASNDNWDPNKEPDSAMLQIARLMQQLGLEENLNGNPNRDSSAVGAFTTNCMRTFENFGYSCGGEEISLPGDSSFVYMYYDGTPLQKGPVIELKNGYYCLMSGGMYIPGQDLTVSHCWLLHGLMSIGTKNYFLCNFGWGGYGDGYYFAGAFNSKNGPDYQEDGKTKSVDYIGNIHRITFDYNIGIRK